MGKATLEVLCWFEKIPAVVVTNDWFTGLVPAYAKQGFFGDTFAGTTFMHICHNMNPTYEGRLYPGPGEGLMEHIHGLPQWYFVNPDWSRNILNPSRCAILASDQWSTVSPSYRNELLSASPLRDLLKQKPQPFAFNNGIPKAERFARLPYEGDHIRAKEFLQQKYFNYSALDNSVPLFAFVGRITEQKGVHLILEAAEPLINKFGGKI
jgi:starch synthase